MKDESLIQKSFHFHSIMGKEEALETLKIIEENPNILSLLFSSHDSGFKSGVRYGFIRGAIISACLSIIAIYFITTF